MTAAVPAPPCPQCQSPRTRRQEQRSAEDDEFDYLRCDDCSHEWMAPEAAARVCQRVVADYEVPPMLPGTVSDATTPERTGNAS
jgi:hypothetical protein